LQLLLEGHKYMRQPKLCNRAFTLIELLVVIAVVGIIAAILFPVFARAREKGRQITCMSNERQLGIASTEYSEDSDEYYPNLVVGADGDGVVGGWVYYATFNNGFDVTRGTLFPYVKNKAVYVCPDDRHAGTNQLSYAMNSCLAGNEVNNLLVGKPESEFPETSDIMLFGEEADNSTAGDPNPGPSSTDTDSTDDGYFLYEANAFSTRHNDGSIVVFLDGHAKWLHDGSSAQLNSFTGGADQCP